MLNLSRACLTLWLTIFAAVASAGEAPPGAPPQRLPMGWVTELGLGLIANPEYQGSEDYRLLAVPYFDLRYLDQRGVKAFFNVPQGLGAYLLRERLDNGNRFALSAALAPGFQNRDSDQFTGLETFGIGLEARLGMEYDLGRWSLQAGVAQAIASGHEGLYGNLSANYRFNLGRGAFAGIGPSVRLGNKHYMAALYSVTPAESEASGLDAYGAGSGAESVAVQGILSLPVGERWRFTSVARLGRLVGDAADSSLTVEPTQAFIVTALTRRF